MSCRDPYCYIEAFIEADQIDWTVDGELCQPVTVMMVDDTGEIAPAACPLTPDQARNLAFELLVCAEHAERLANQRDAER
jgi:hypothetical protein